MSELRRLFRPALLLTALLAVDVIFQPFPFGLAFRAWLVALGGLVAAALVRGTLAPYSQVQVEPVRLRSRGRPAAERPAGLEEVERAIDFAVWNPADLNRRLRPLLREVAAHRLGNRHGVDIDRQPERGRHLLGAVAWELIQGAPGGEAGHPPIATTLPAMRETIQRLEDL